MLVFPIVRLRLFERNLRILRISNHISNGIAASKWLEEDVGERMPYHIRAGSIRAIVANEREALELLRRLTDSDREEVSITDIFGGEIDVAKLQDPASPQKV